MKKCSWVLFVCFSQSILATPAVDLFTVAQSAINKNFNYQMSHEQMLADQSQANEAYALWFPQIGLQGARIHGHYSTDLDDTSLLNLNAHDSFDTESNYWIVGARQQLFNMTNLAQATAATAAKSIATLRYATAQQKLLKQTINAYFNVLLTQELINVANSNLIAANKELKDAHNLKNNGMAVTADVQESNADKQNALLKVLQTNNNATLALQDLNDICNSNYSQFEKLKSGFLQNLPRVPDVAYWESEALRYNPNLKILQLQIIYFRRKELAAEFRGLPEISAYASYAGGYSKNAGIAGSSFGTQNVNINTGGAITGVGYHYRGSTVGVEMEMPLFAGGYNWDKESQQAHLMKKAQFQLDDGRQQIRLAVDQSYQRLMADKQSMILAKAELDAANSGLINMQRQVNSGFNSPLDLSDARTKYISAQENLIQAKYQYIEELVQLKYLVGDLNQKTVMAINYWLQ